MSRSSLVVCGIKPGQSSKSLIWPISHYKQALKTGKQVWAKTSAVCKSPLIWGDPFEMTRCFTLVNYDRLHRKETNSLFMVFCAIRYGRTCLLALFHTGVHRFASVSMVTMTPRLFWTYPKDKHREHEVPIGARAWTQHLSDAMMGQRFNQPLQDDVTKRDTTTRRYIPVAFLIILVGPAQWIKVRYLFFGKCCASVISAISSEPGVPTPPSEARTKAVTVTCPNWQRPGQQCV